VSRNVRDQFLLHRIHTQKDREAFDQLAQNYQGTLYRLLRSKLPTDQDADDALSTTLFRTWDYLTRTADIEHVGGLFFTVGRSVIAEFYRTRKESVSIESMQEAGLDIASTKQGKEATVASAEIRLVTECMDELDGEERTLILLRHVEGHSIRVIAQKVGKSEGATRVAIHRAMKKLRNLFEPRV